MTINLKAPDIRELKPRITVFGCGGAGGNAVNNMIECGLIGCDFVVANTDAQALSTSKAERVIQMGLQVTEGLGAGSQPEVGRAAAEEVMDELRDHLSGAHMVFITAGMGGGTGTGAAPVVAKVARELGILTVGVVTKPFQFEGGRRMRLAEAGIVELQKHVDTLIVIPNQNLFRVANEKTTFSDAFAMADQVLYSGVASITDLMVKPGLINLDFADVRTVMRDMGKAMMGTGEATGEGRALKAAEAAIANPLLDEVSMKGAKGLLISITGGADMMLYELDEAATRIREEVDPEANIILGATKDESLEGIIRVSVVATGIDRELPMEQPSPTDARIAEVSARLRAQAAARAEANAQAAAMPSPLSMARAPAAPATYQQAGYAPEPFAAAASPDVVIRPVGPRPVLFAEPIEEATAQQPADLPAAFIPPAPERQMIKPTRMPRVEELPLPAQAQVASPQAGQMVPSQPQAYAAPAAYEQAPPPHAAETKRMTLLQRLAAVGLGRRDEEETETVRQEPMRQEPMRQEPAPVAYAPAQAPVQAAAPHADYARRQVAPAYRPAQGSLDAQGRAVAANRGADDEQLEIPAFLRRQVN
jgi:cell division protein FtsZ